ncbi:MAG: adenylate/guanylate cyclase domain-containing protein [Pseudomonadota bacterium]
MPYRPTERFCPLTAIGHIAWTVTITRRVLRTPNSDIRGFTSISETYLDNPQELTSLINSKLTPLSHAIIEARGTIDKYIGDAIVAFWNAPLEDKGHAANACSAALEMIERLDAFNEQRRVKAETASIHFVPLRIGIGVNSDNCVVGNV